jgi:hypothetical protein
VLVYRGKGACSAPVGGPSTPTLTTMAEGGIGVEEPQAPLAVNGRDVWSTLPDFSRDVDMLETVAEQAGACCMVALFPNCMARAKTRGHLVWITPLHFLHLGTALSRATRDAPSKACPHARRSAPSATRSFGRHGMPHV